VVGAATRPRGGGREEEKRGRERVGMPVGCTRTARRERDSTVRPRWGAFVAVAARGWDKGVPMGTAGRVGGREGVGKGVT
jgi:hypothetical protein